MKKISLLVIAFILFTGCSYVPKSVKNIVSGDDNNKGVVYSTKCGKDGCGRTYKDTTYRKIVEANPCNDCNNKSLMNDCNECNKKQDVINNNLPKNTPILEKDSNLRVNVIGQGVAPTNTSSPAQAYALAKRAAIAEAYRLLAEKIKGVYVEGQDLVKNMMVTRSSVRTSVSATIKNANLVETTFKEGLCEVEMEVTISHSQFL